ncbi:hypothetical protein [Brucella pituitosa]|uniref:hypothetical protein n=1 Tax=Brucella pituitosa TaxID=571256 RepID=UPI0013E32027|nr:hypothetical protein [Brucella pituitosa]
MEKLIPIYFRVDPIDDKPNILAVSLMFLNVFGFPALDQLPADAEFVARTLASNH